MDPREGIQALVAGLDDALLRALYGRSMLLTREWSREHIDTLCALAEVFEAFDRAGIPTLLFANELNLALFFDKSTRTKASWAGAATRLGAQPIVMDAATTQVSHGESSEETGAMLGMAAHAVGIRHDLILGEGNRFMRDAQKGIDDYLRANNEHRVVPVINLQCDIDHPTQTLADLCWLRERFPQGLEGKTVAVSWAYSPSYAKPLSVPQGLITLLTRFGMNVRLAHPKGYNLVEECMESAYQSARVSGGSFETFQDMDASFRGADIVYPKSWGPGDLMLERVEANRRGDTKALGTIEQRALERNQSHTGWICDERRMGLTRRADALYMHCLPADIGAEVSPGVMQQSRFDVAREANKKLYVIMALLASAKEPRLRERLESFTSQSVDRSTADNMKNN
jgi:knotted carbamoyltransferase YgeW